MTDAASGGRLPDYTLYAGSSAPDTLQAPSETEPTASLLEGTALLAVTQPVDTLRSTDAHATAAIPRRVIQHSPLGRKSTSPPLLTGATA
jgi:hypothetical protein